jgi:2-methylcitrate dehydratase PrpD
MSKTRSLVEGVHAITYADLGPEDLTAVRSLLLDHIGVVAGGSTTDSAVRSRTALFRLAGHSGVTSPVIGAHTEVAPIAAAMANAIAGHAIEYDDVHNTSSSHPGVVIFPAVMAATTLGGGDEHDFVRGVVIGYEVMCRVGRAANPSAHYARHFHPTGTAGALGAAAGAAAALGLGVDEMVSAIGIAASMASGSMQFLVDGAWTKRLHPALAARSGVEAAVLAEAGYQGTEDGIAGDRGFLAGYTGDPRPELLLAELGERPLEVTATSIKAHTCCRYNQGPIDALLAIRAEHGLGPDDIESITIGVPSVAVDILLEPAALKRRPQSVVDAQFSMPYGLAVATHYGRAALEEYSEDKLAQPELVALMDRVSYQVDPEIDALYPERWRAWARVRTTDGRDLFSDLDEPKGDPGNPLSPDELREKFDGLAAPVYDESARSAIGEHALSVGEPGSWKGLVSALV